MQVDITDMGSIPELGRSPQTGHDNPLQYSCLRIPCTEEPSGLWSISSVQFSSSVVSNSLWPHEPQHTRPPCPSSTPRVYPNSCPLSWWCHLTISSSVVPSSSCLQSIWSMLPSRFSRVQLCATPEMTPHQALPSLGFSRQEHWSGLPLPSPMNESEKWKSSLSAMSDSSQPHGLQPTRLLCPWDSPGKSTGVGCHCLLRYGP